MKTVTLKLPFSDKEFEVSGSKIDKSIIGAIEYSNGFYEINVMNVLNNIIKKDDLCIDIGANIGVLSLAISSLADKGNVYSFEPSKSNFHFLNNNLNFRT